MSARITRTTRVLVRVPSWLGDAVMCEPVLRALAEVSQPSFAGPARLLALFDGRFEGAPRITTDDVSAWRGHDVALLLTGSFRSAWTALRAGIPERVGFARDGRSALLTDGMRPAREAGGVPLGLGISGRFPRHLPRPFGTSCVELAARIGVTVRDRRPRLEVAPMTLERAKRRLDALGLVPGEPFVLMNAGARPGSAKGLPPSTWSALCDELAHRTGMPMALVCGPGEEAALLEARAGAKRARVLPIVEPAAGLTELVALCSLAALFATADSGPRHIAVAVGTPVLVACGPTDPRHTADHLDATRIVRVEVPCGPCHRERCPLTGAEHHICMRRIEVGALADAAEALLRYHSAPSRTARSAVTP